MAAAPCMSLMGSKKLATSSIVAIGVIVVVMGLCQVQEADAAGAVAVIDLSLVPVNVTARVIGSTQAPITVTVGVGANVTLLPLTTSATLLEITITNLVNNASSSAQLVTISANATSTILITSAQVPFILDKVNAIIGTLNGLVFSLLPPPKTIVISL